MKIRVHFERPESIVVEVPEDVVYNDDEQAIYDWFWDKIGMQEVYVEDWDEAR